MMMLEADTECIAQSVQLMAVKLGICLLRELDGTDILKARVRYSEHIKHGSECVNIKGRVVCNNGFSLKIWLYAAPASVKCIAVSDHGGRNTVYINIELVKLKRFGLDENFLLLGYYAVFNNADSHAAYA